MISPISTTSKYILQPNLIHMHQQSLTWLSATEFWKRELTFFQKLLDQNASRLVAIQDKKSVDHFQNLLIYYNGELVDELRKQLRDHEKKLALMLKQENEANTQYFQEHEQLIERAASFEKSFQEFKHEFYALIEKAMM